MNGAWPTTPPPPALSERRPSFAARALLSPPSTPSASAVISRQTSASATRRPSFSALSSTFLAPPVQPPLPPVPQLPPLTPPPGSTTPMQHPADRDRQRDQPFNRAASPAPSRSRFSEALARLFGSASSGASGSSLVPTTASPPSTVTLTSSSSTTSSATTDNYGDTDSITTGRRFSLARSMSGRSSRTATRKRVADPTTPISRGWKLPSSATSNTRSLFPVQQPTPKTDLSPAQSTTFDSQPSGPAAPRPAEGTLEEYVIEHFVPAATVGVAPQKFLDTVIADDRAIRDLLRQDFTASSHTVASNGDVFYTFTSHSPRGSEDPSTRPSSIAETEPASPVVPMEFPTYFRATGAALFDEPARIQVSSLPRRDSGSGERRGVEGIEDLPLPLQFEEDDLIVVNPNRATLIHKKPIFAYDEVTNDFGTLNTLWRSQHRRHMSDASTILDDLNAPQSDDNDDGDFEPDRGTLSSRHSRARQGILGVQQSESPVLSTLSRMAAAAAARTLAQNDMDPSHPAQNYSSLPGLSHRHSRHTSHLSRLSSSHLHARGVHPRSSPTPTPTSASSFGDPARNAYATSAAAVAGFDDVARVLTRVVTLERNGRKSVVRVVSVVQSDSVASPPASASAAVDPIAGPASAAAATPPVAPSMLFLAPRTSSRSPLVPRSTIAAAYVATAAAPAAPLLPAGHLSLTPDADQGDGASCGGGSGGDLEDRTVPTPPAPPLDDLAPPGTSTSSSSYSSSPSQPPSLPAPLSSSPTPSVSTFEMHPPPLHGNDVPPRSRNGFARLFRRILRDRR
ncbi:hypothetical protein HK405_000399 [Cladochytrium tenue]|nr:hypothetical protein HK405_000399 [Cladochytrium tenue]